MRRIKGRIMAASLIGGMLLLCLAAGVNSAGASLAQRAQKSGPKFDPDGEFLPIGNAPKGFENVGSIVLMRQGPRGYLNKRSGVYLTNNVTVRFRTATVTREKFAFETLPYRGITYSFEGRFLKGGVFAELELDTEAPMLEGHLTKNKGGQKIAEAEMKFSYFGGT